MTSANNKIVAGNLDVDLYLWGANGSTEITENSEPLFGSKTGLAQDNAADTLWEPGKTQVVYLSIKNNGSLDLKYRVALEVRNPADSKDLYKVLTYDIVEDAQFGSVDAWSGNGVAVELGTNATQAVDVALKAGAEHFFALAIHMDENAGDDYQDGSVEFDVKVLAGQLASESDSFNSSYDVDADYGDNSTAPTPPLVYVSTAADLKAALSPAISNDQATVILANDITLADGETWTPLDLEAYTGGVRNIVIDGQGHTIKGLNAPLLGNNYFGNTSAVIKNLTLANSTIDNMHYNGLGSGAFIASADNCSSITLENCHLVDSTITATDDFTGIGGLVGYSSSDLTITNCSVTNCTINGAQNSAGAIAGHVSAGHSTTITNAKVVGCTVKGERADKSGYVVGTANNGATTITTSADCANNTVFDVANSDKIYGRLVGGTLTVNGVAQ